MILYLWLLSHCTEVETKFEYNRSQLDLSSFLKRKETAKALGAKCINAITKLQLNLRSKEFKLANNIRMEMRNCMDASTTFPAESNNNAIKHGAFSIHSNMNLDTATQRLLGGINSRLVRQRNNAHRELIRSNLALSAPTKEWLIRKGQGLIDRNYDRRDFIHSAQIGPFK